MRLPKVMKNDHAPVTVVRFEHAATGRADAFVRTSHAPFAGHTGTERFAGRLKAALCLPLLTRFTPTVDALTLDEVMPSDLRAHMAPNKGQAPRIFNFVLTKDAMCFAPRAKHFTLAKVANAREAPQIPSVLFAGRAWIDGMVFHIAGNSGTYRSSRVEACAVARFIESLLPGTRAAFH